MQIAYCTEGLRLTGSVCQTKLAEVDEAVAKFSKFSAHSLEIPEFPYSIVSYCEDQAMYAITSSGSSINRKL